MKNKWLIFCVILTLLTNCLIPSMSSELVKAAGTGSNLGVANEYNVFVLNNHYQSYSDAEGRVAVGNEAKYVGYGIGDKLSNSKDRFDLVVGKKIDITGGTNFNGNTAIGTDGTVVNYTMTNNNRENNPIVADVIDFDAAYTSLKSTSNAWSKLTANGKVKDVYGTLTFTGTSEELNIFTVTTDQLALGKINGIKFDVPESATVLVNVFGKSLLMGNLQIFHKDSAATGSNAGKWMWNFPELETLDLRGMSMYGSVLAPDCTFSPSGSGNFNGTVVFQNFYNEDAGGYESHHYPFNCYIPTNITSEQIGSIAVTKVDAADNHPLAGAEFTLTQNGEEVGKVVTDEAGKASFTDLSYGTYELTETKAPEGYQLTGEAKEVTIGEGQNEYSFTFTNEKVVEPKGSISILKVDAADNHPLAGAEFTLTQNGEEVGKVVTDEAGKASFTDLSYGTYELTETKAPEGYQLTGEVKEVTIGEEQSEYSFTFTNEKVVEPKGSISILKVDAADNHPLAGAEFTLTQNGEEVGKVVTDEAGKASFKDLSYGTYELTETKAPEGYQLTGEVKEVTIGEEQSEYSFTFTNEKVVEPKGSISILKVDAADKHPLAGAEFTLTQNGEEVGKVVTDEAGKASFKDLSYGTYELTETKAPEGYQLSEEVKEVTIGEGQNEYSFTFTDEKVVEPKGSISILKVDAADKHPLAGAEFTLTQNGEEVGKVVTDEAGKASFKDLSYGTYELSETKAPEGYQLTGEVKEVTIGDEQSEYSFTFTNEKIVESKGSISILKVDAADNHPLAGAEFTLTQNGEEVGKVVTDEAGKASFTDLSYGTYELSETKAPEGYHLTGEVKEVTIGEEQSEYSFTFTNEKIVESKGSISILKVDAADNHPLAGAEFTLTQNGEEVGKVVTDEAGKASFTELSYGTYELTETKAPEGYQLSEEVKEVTIGEEQSEYSFTFTNEKIVEPKGSISILKVDAADNHPLAGAEFTLTQNGEEVGKVVTDEAGKASFTDLSYGTYELTETKAPEGYQLSEEVKEVTIGEEQNEYSFTFTNEIIQDPGQLDENQSNSSSGIGTDTLPQTGEKWVRLMMTAGIFFLLAAVAVLTVNSKRKNKMNDYEM